METPLALQCSVPLLGLLTIGGLCVMLEKRSKIPGSHLVALNAVGVFTVLYLAYLDMSVPSSVIGGVVLATVCSGCMFETIHRADSTDAVPLSNALMATPMVPNQVYEFCDGQVSPVPLQAFAPPHASPSVYAATPGQEPAPEAGQRKQVTMIASCQDLPEDLDQDDYYQLKPRPLENPQLMDLVVQVPKTCFPEGMAEPSAADRAVTANPRDMANRRNRTALDTLSSGAQAWNSLILLNFVSLWLVATINFVYLRQMAGALDQNARGSFFQPPMPTPDPPPAAGPGPSVNFGTCDEVGRKLKAFLPWNL